MGLESGPTHKRQKTLGLSPMKRNTSLLGIRDRSTSGYKSASDESNDPRKGDGLQTRERSG